MSKEIFGLATDSISFWWIWSVVYSELMWVTKCLQRWIKFRGVVIGIYGRYAAFIFIFIDTRTLYLHLRRRKRQRSRTCIFSSAHSPVVCSSQNAATIKFCPLGLNRSHYVLEFLVGYCIGHRGVSTVERMGIIITGHINQKIGFIQEIFRVPGLFSPTQPYTLCLGVLDIRWQARTRWRKAKVRLMVGIWATRCVHVAVR